MGFKAYKAHYLNKFPGSQVSYNESSLDVYRDGEHLVHLEKDGHGIIQDRSDEQGCSSKHDLSPIPKNARAHKLHKDGKLGKSEEYSERKSVGLSLDQQFGHVPSIDELKKQKFEFDAEGNVKLPEPKPAPQPQVEAPKASEVNPSLPQM